MLVSNLDLSIPEEADFLVTMSDRPRRYERTDRFDLETFLTDLLEDPHFRSWGVSEQEARSALDEVAPRSFADAMRALFRHCALRDGKTRYGNKTPQAVEAIPRLAQLFPEARFIHIIRDGRDVAISHIHTVGFMRSVGEVALLWRAAIEQGQNAGRLIGTNRYREVRYEELVESPAQALRPLCEYVELDFHPDMLRYHEMATRSSRLDPAKHSRACIAPLAAYEGAARLAHADVQARSRDVRSDRRRRLG